MRIFGKTDKGAVRANNQDMFRFIMKEEDGMAFLVLCDGMGGARAGNVASDRASECFLEHIQRAVGMTDSNDLADLVEDAVRAANKEVYELSISQDIYAGMGTTLVGGICLEDRIILANVGDSRAYMLQGTRIAHMTQDHSLVAELVRSGRLTPEEAETYPNKNLITRAVGVDAFVQPDLYEIKIHPGQTLLLCSDGLSGMLPDDRIAQICAASSSQEEACNHLIEAACAAGGTDNITVVLYTKEI